MSARTIPPEVKPYLDRIAAIRSDEPFPDIVLAAVNLLAVVMPAFEEAERLARSRGARAVPGVACAPFYMVVNLSMVPLESDGVVFGPMALIFFKDGHPWAATSFIGDQSLAFVGVDHEAVRALPQPELEAFGRQLEDDLIAAINGETARRKAAAKAGMH